MSRVITDAARHHASDEVWESSMTVEEVQRELGLLKGDEIVKSEVTSAVTSLAKDTGSRQLPVKKRTMWWR